MAVDSAEGSILRGQLVHLHGRGFAAGGTVEACRRQALRTCRAEKACAHGSCRFWLRLGGQRLPVTGPGNFSLADLVGWSH